MAEMLVDLMAGKKVVWMGEMMVVTMVA